MLLSFRKPLFLALSVIVFGLVTRPADAGFVTRVSVETLKDGSAYVLVNGQRAIHLKTPNANLSPARRAQITAERLTARVQSGLDPKTVWYKQVGNEARVMTGDSLLVIASVPEARAHKLSTPRLAQAWVLELRRCLSLPPLAATPTTLLVPLGEARSVAVSCLLSSPVQADVSDGSVIAVDGKQKSGFLIVTGVSAGNAIINLRCEGYSVPVQVAVRKYAARPLAQTVRGVVTGRNAPRGLITQTAAETARRAAVLEPGARLVSAQTPQIEKDLAPGQMISMPVQVQAAGSDYIPAKFKVQVEVTNQSLPNVPTGWIMYSNDPERVLKYQVLFTGRATSTEESVRLLYHHQNMMQRRIGFVIDVVNASPSPASLHLIEGISSPMVDTVIVGYKAGLEFVENQRSNVGRIIELPPGSRQSIVSQPLDCPYTASGILELRQLFGDPLLIRVIAKPESQRLDEDPLGVVSPATSIDPSRVALSDHIYPGPVKNLDVTYTAGKSWLFLRIGKEALKHASQDKQLYGNYGVTYDIRANLENPSEYPHDVEIAFEATAGPAGGIFLLDGNMVRVKSLQPPSELRLGSVTIPAGKSRMLSIKTIPLSGSAYPATIIIRPAGTTGAVSSTR